MENPTDFSDDEIKQAYDQTLVRLLAGGYVSRLLEDDRAGQSEITLTATGERLRHDLRRIIGQDPADNLLPFRMTALVALLCVTSNKLDGR